MEGGSLLATGSSSCIFRPNIPCKDSNDKQTNRKVSKIVYGNKAKRYYNKEKLITKLIKQIKGYKKWCIIYDKFCQPPDYSNIFVYEPKILECKDEYYSSIFNETSKMMISRYGGTTFEDYFISSLQNNKEMDTKMFDLMVKMKQLFIGLKEIYHNKLIHLDIKYNNIVLDGKFFKYIDFGLSGELHDLTHFKNRSLSEFNTKRIYIWYPLEYLYGSIDESDKYDELNKFKSRYFRKHYSDGLNVHRLFDVNLNNHVKELLSSKKTMSDEDYKNMISMIDVYSLGIMIPFLFNEYNLTKYINSSRFLKDLFKLFKKMCEIDHKQRINPDECLKEYNKLMRKYSHLSSKKGKKTKKKKLS
jgi:serine/threonine protein kinase